MPGHTEDTDSAEPAAPQCGVEQTSSAGLAKIENSDAVVAVSLFVIALAIRIVYVLEAYEAPFFDLNWWKGTDMHRYITWAREIAAGDWIGTKVFWQAPLHPYFLGLLLWFSGDSLLAACLFQALLGALSCVLVYAAARQVLSPQFAALAAALFALYEAAIFFTAILLSTTLAVFCASAVLLLLMLAYRYGSIRLWGLAGLGMGLASLARPNFLLLAAAVAGVSLVLSVRGGNRLPGWPQGRRLAAPIGIFLLLFCAAVLPVTVRNYAVCGRPVIVSDNGPATYRLANSYDSLVFNFIYPKKPLMPPWTGAFWLHQVKKAAGFWVAQEVPQNVDMYLGRRYSRVLRLPLIPFIVIGSLGMAGILLGTRRFRDLFPVYLFAGTYYFSMIPFYMISRFRLPVVPALVIFSALTVKTITDLLRDRRRARAGVVVLLVAALGAASFPWRMPRLRISGLNNLSIIMLQRGEMASAAELMKESLEIYQEQPDTHLRLGRTLAVQGDSDGAIRHLEAAVRLRPHDPEPYRLLGSVWLTQKNDVETGRKWFRRYSELCGQK